MKIIFAIIALLFLGCEQPQTVDWATYRPELPAAPVPVALDTKGAAPAAAVENVAGVLNKPDQQAGAGDLAPRENRAPASISLDSDPSFDLPTKAKPGKLSFKPREVPDAPPAEEPEQLAVASNPDVKPHQTIAIIYCQPGCVPCAMLIRDLKAAGWKVGHGDKGHFKVVDLLTLDAFTLRNVPRTPQVAFFIDGIEREPRILGYDGSQAALAAIIQAHPTPKAKRVTTTFNGQSQASPLWYESAPTAVWPLTSYAGGFLTTVAPVPSTVVYESAPVVYSDIYTGPMFAAPIYRAPVYAAPNGLTVGPATSSAQLNVFGFPIIGGSVGTQGGW